MSPGVPRLLTTARRSARPLRSRLLRRYGGVLGGALVGDAPDRPAGVVGDEQRAVLGNRQRGRATPDFGALLARDPEAGREILVVAFRPAVLERHPHDLVPGRDRAVPRAFHRDKQAALVFRRELVALVEDQVEQRGMRLEQQVGVIVASTLSGASCAK